jgi:hypothetical protein
MPRGDELVERIYLAQVIQDAVEVVGVVQTS